MSVPSEAGSPAENEPADEAPVKTVRQGRLATNALSNFLGFAFNVVVGIWFTPFLIHRLGFAAFGLIPLANTLTSYMAVITAGLNSSVSRFLTIALERGDTDRANRIFNTSLFGSVALGLLLLGPSLWFAWNCDRFLKIPPGYENQTRFLFICTIGAFLLNEIITPFEVSSFCRNRFDLRSLGSALEMSTRVGVVVILFTLTAPQTWHVGFGILLATCVSALYALPIWKRLTPMLRIRPRDFDREMLGELTRTGAWVIVAQIGVILFLQIDLLVANRLLGPEDAGKYGAVIQWSALLRTLGNTISGVFAPTIMYLIAREDTPGLIDEARRAVRLLGLALALPIGFICGFSHPLLAVWLGPQAAGLAPVMSLATIHLCINLAYLPLHYISQGTNNVRWPGIVTLLMGAVNLGIALLFCGPFGWGLYGLAAAGAIVLSLRNLLFTPLYAAHVLHIGKTTFLREILPLSATTLVLAAMGWMVSRVVPISNWATLFAMAGVVTVLYGLVAYNFLLSSKERQQASKLLAPLMRKLPGKRSGTS